jgi:D-apionolactonase
MKVGRMSLQVQASDQKSRDMNAEKQTSEQGLELRAGPLSMRFEGGGLRYIRFGRCEVLRRVYVAVRDRNWGTVPWRVAHLKSEIGRDSFRIEFDCEHRQGEIDFLWRGTITGAPDGAVVFSFDGVARSTFHRNRIGFCVLHPISECAGRPCEVIHTSGETEQGCFPAEIAPHQPFKDIRALTHEIFPGLRATTLMEGETFEMEDQRNWTDSSFKTYGTPLELPFPVEVKKDEKFSQRVTLRLTGCLPEPALIPSSAPPEIRLFVESHAARKLPRIGLGVANHKEALTELELERLRMLGLSHLRVDLYLSQDDSESRLERAAAEALALNAELEAALFISDAAPAELRRLLASVRRIRPHIASWLIFHVAEKVTSARWVSIARETLRRYDPDVLVGAGTDLWFTEINRGLPPAEEADLLCFALSPQVHAGDDLTLVENLEAQAAAVQNAKRLSGGKPLSITPVTLKPRFSASATGPEVPPEPGELPPQVDARQPSLFAAVWTLGSIKYLAESGASSVTYYETTGWRGVIERETGSPQPDKFLSLPGAVFPIWHALADVGEFANGEILCTPSSDALKVIGLTLRHTRRTRMLIANLTADPQVVQIAIAGANVWMKRLNGRNLREVMLTPESFRAKEGDELRTENGQLRLSLLPHELLRLDDRPEAG